MTLACPMFPSYWLARCSHHTPHQCEAWPVPTHYLLPAVEDPRVSMGAWFSREAEMCPPRLFLPNLVPTELRFGSKSPPAERSWLPGLGVDEPAPQLRASWTPFPKQRPHLNTYYRV